MVANKSHFPLHMNLASNANYQNLSRIPLHTLASASGEPTLPGAVVLFCELSIFLAAQSWNRESLLSRKTPTPDLNMTTEITTSWNVEATMECQASHDTPYHNSTEKPGLRIVDSNQINHGKTFGEVGSLAVKTSTPVSVTFTETAKRLGRWETNFLKWNNKEKLHYTWQVLLVEQNQHFGMYLGIFIGKNKAQRRLNKVWK